jgi:hypothetical protein
MRITSFWAILSILSAAGVYADYQIKTVKVLPIESYPARLTLGGVTIAADPYGTDERCFTAFDVRDLNSRGYYLVHVIIQNSSPTFISIRTQSIVLVKGSEQQLYTTPATIVVQDVIKGSLLSKLPKMKSHDPTTSTRAGSPLVDFTSKELTNRQIEPGTVSDGFVFFYTPKPNKDFFNGSVISIPQVIEEGTRKTLGPFNIPLNKASAAQ